jgi:hypothetical protein
VGPAACAPRHRAGILTTQQRFLSRGEWPLIAAGVAAGLLTAAVLLYLFFAGIRGSGGGIDPALVGETDVTVVDGGDPDRPVPDGPGSGVIGARERGIWSRLEGLRVVARPIRGPLAVTARDLVWNEPGGERFARAAFISANLNAAAAARNDYLLDNVIVRRPVVNLRQPAPRAEWNFAAVFEELLAGGPEVTPRRTIQLRNVQVLDGTVEVTRPEQRFTLRSAQARMPLVVLSQPGVPAPYLRLATLEMQFDQVAPLPAQLAIRARDGLFHFPDGRVRFEVASAFLNETELASLDGVWDPADPGYGITATGLALGVRFEDVAFTLPPAFPGTGTASFAWSVRPLPGDLTEATLTELEAASGGSLVFGSLTARFGEEFFLLRSADLRVDPLELALVEGFTGPLPYGGIMTGRITGTDGDIAFDLTANLTAPGLSAPFAVDLTGRALLQDDGVLLQRATVDFNRLPLAALRALAPALPVAGFVTGSVALTGMPTESPLELDVRLEVGAGVALVEGTLDFRDDIPRYDLTGRLLGVDLQAVLAPAVPPAALTANFSLRGSGFDPEVMDASVRLSGRFSGWETGPADEVEIVADIRRGTLDVQRFDARLATAEVSASGSWRFLEPQSGAVAYAVNVSSLRPFGPYLPVVGDDAAAGTVVATGSISGSLERFRLRGEVTATSAQVGPWETGSLAADYDIAFGGGLLPEAVVNATARSVATPTVGTFEDVVLSLRLTAPEFALNVDGRRPGGGAARIVATGTMPEDGPRVIVLERAEFDLEEGRWALAQPATIHWVGDEWRIENFALEDSESDGLILVDGRVLPMVGIDARIRIAELPTAGLQRLFGLDPRIEGLLWVDGTVRGEPENPVVDLEFRLEEGSIEGVALRQLAGTIAHRDQETFLDARVLVDTIGRLDLQARLPSRLQIGGTPVFELIDGMPLSGSVTASQFAIGALAALSPVDVRDVTGVLNAQMTLSGTAEAPLVAGSAVLAGGQVRIPILNQTYTEISGGIDLDGRRLVITDLRARSDGWVAASGHVVLERLDRPVVELSVAFDGFRPMGVENQRDGALFGGLRIAGPPAALTLTGNMRADDGYFVIPQFGGGRPELVDITRPAPVLGREMEAIDGAGGFESLAIQNLRVTSGDGAWYMADEARIQLSGDLVVNKSGSSFPVTGTLEGSRGQYTLIAGPLVRRFEIVNAQVRFLGAPTPNPAIDITARRIVFDPGGRQVDVNVRISGTLNNPRLSLAGGESVGIAESELLSFLIFGQPTFALGGGFTPGDAILEQTFVGGFAELMAIELERGLGGFGLDIFQIRLGRGRLGGLGAPMVVLGRQLREDVFLTVETGIAALFGGSGSGEAPNHWAVRLEWAFDPQSRAMIAVEPVYTGRAFRGAVFALPVSDLRHQLLLEMRRRWTY